MTLENQSQRIAQEPKNIVDEEGELVGVTEVNTVKSPSQAKNSVRNPIRRVFGGARETVQGFVQNRAEVLHFNDFINDTVKQFEADIVIRVKSFRDPDSSPQLELHRGFRGKISLPGPYGLGIDIQTAGKLVSYMNSALVDRDTREMSTQPFLEVLTKEQLMGSRLITQAVSNGLTELTKNPKFLSANEALTGENLRRAVVDRLYPIYLRYIDAVRGAVAMPFESRKKYERDVNFRYEYKKHTWFIKCQVCIRFTKVRNTI
jgi:hypothetical protein